MQRLLILMTGMLLFTASKSNGQELVYQFVPDTVTYEQFSDVFNVIPNPEDLIQRIGVLFYFDLKRKNSETYDIFSRIGKIGSVIVSNTIRNQYTGGNMRPCLTQKFFDNDDGWEVLLQGSSGVILLDDDGSTLFSEVNNDTTYYSANIGFDGSSTYLVVIKLYSNFSPSPYKLYRFRTNVTSPSLPHTLSKKSAGPNSMMVFGSSGDYQISLQPAGGGKTSVQLFDMLGRLVFEKRIDDLTKPVSFSVPAAQTSRSPFITKVQDQNGTTLKKEIPVR